MSIFAFTCWIFPGKKLPVLYRAALSSYMSCYRIIAEVVRPIYGPQASRCKRGADPSHGINVICGDTCADPTKRINVPMTRRCPDPTTVPSPHITVAKPFAMQTSQKLDTNPLRFEDGGLWKHIWLISFNTFRMRTWLANLATSCPCALISWNLRDPAPHVAFVYTLAIVSTVVSAALYVHRHIHATH
jgi:hypothetical protein